MDCEFSTADTAEIKAAQRGRPAEILNGQRFSAKLPKKIIDFLYSRAAVEKKSVNKILIKILEERHERDTKKN